MRQGAAEAKVRCEVLTGKRKVAIEIEVLLGRRDRAWQNGHRVPGTRGSQVLRTTLFIQTTLCS